MNPESLNLILEIVETGAAIAAGTTSGKTQEIVKVSEALTSIVQKALAAHIAVTGQPIDEAAIKPFEPLV